MQNRLPSPHTFPNSDDSNDDSDTSPMASKIITAFTGPLTATAIEAWLGQCEDGFAIYTSTKTDKAPDLSIETKIRLAGANMQEPTMAGWWNAGHMDFLKLTSWETFEKQIRSRFMPKGYKMVALRTFFLCAQNRHSFLDYAAALADARNALGPTIVNLLFHSHPMLLLHIMSIPDFDLETISFDNLVALMSMQWESLIMEIPATRSTPGPGPARTSSTTTILLTANVFLQSEGVGGAERSPVMRVGLHMLATPALEILPEVSLLADFAALKTPTIKREPMGAILLDAKEYFAQGEDLPDDSIPVCYRDDDTDSDACNQPN
ncbi:hypothetical protein BU17DRAFT_69582 [Hysterangium stoloniferum]|nr:hypothetical protein BU17DRAFT_69582 [Hysterangium stoloniferum]